MASVIALISCHISALFFFYPLSFDSLSFNTAVHSFTASQNNKKYTERDHNATILKLARGTQLTVLPLINWLVMAFCTQGQVM